MVNRQQFDQVIKRLQAFDNAAYNSDEFILVWGRVDGMRLWTRFVESGRNLVWLIEYMSSDEYSKWAAYIQATLNR